MGMTNHNLCDSCTNIGCEFQSGIVRTECAFYMPPHLEPDSCGNFVVIQPTVYAIPKDQYEQRLKENNELINDLEELRTMINKFAESYENRLKADMEAMLKELKKEIEELWDNRHDVWLDNQYYIGKSDTLGEVDEIIQQKIDKLKEQTDGKDN